MSTRPEPQLAEERNPWLGLASFTEATRADFFGREAEIAELARRVQRRLLTVLFGKSGLGKTSLVSAGLVPQLRGQGYCPVPIRISYSSDAPATAQQIRQALLESAGAGASDFIAGVPEDASPWELLHRRGKTLRDASGAALTPLVIFDQFEEIFTLAQSDDAGRARAARLITELADVVENRVPVALEARLEHDEQLTESYDFARSDYRVLIVLREDYLAPLESLKKAMPSLAENRLRLAPMTGNQALAAVLGPGRGLVTEEVAAAIVRFVAGGAELANAEVEPSLLSLICRELNDARIARKASEISLDLLAGSHATILEHFYERALAGQPPAVRRLIEDELLTSSGYRESVAEEDFLPRLASAGAQPGTLAELVNRRLLRIEERLDRRRVELTHDVLCTVVKESRDARQEREAREATERLLAEQREREASARRALGHARRVALGCAALALLALGATIVAYINLGRAQRAQREAQQTRTVANQARIQAERLLGYLSDDFARTLESEGRLDVVAELSRRQIEYFHALPPALRGPDTERDGALALLQHARTARTQGDMTRAQADAEEAVRLLEALRAQGDTSEATATALARCYVVQALLLDGQFELSRSLEAAQRAAGLLRPLAETPHAGNAVRRAYVEALVRLGDEQQQDHLEDAVSSERLALRLADELGARDLSDLDMAAQSAEASWHVIDALYRLGRYEEAWQAGEAGLKLAEAVIARRPDHRTALHAAQALGNSLALLAVNDLKPADAVRLGKRSVQLSKTLLSLDPGNVVTLNNLGAAELNIASGLWLSGELREAIPYFYSDAEHLEQGSQLGTGNVVSVVLLRIATASQLGSLSDLKAAQSIVEAGSPLRQKLRQTGGAIGALTANCAEQLWEVERAWRSEQFDRVAPLLTAARRALQAVPGQDSAITIVRDNCMAWASIMDGMTQSRLGNFAAAEQAWRTVLALRERLANGMGASSPRVLANNKTELAIDVARQGRREEAETLIAPVVQYYRQQSSHNHGDRWVPLELADALYAQALAEPGHRAALLQEASSLLQDLAPQLRPLQDVEWVRKRVLEAQQNPNL